MLCNQEKKKVQTHYRILQLRLSKDCECVAAGKTLSELLTAMAWGTGMRVERRTSSNFDSETPLPFHFFLGFLLATLKLVPQPYLNSTAS